MYSTHLRKEKKYLREKEEETERLLKTKAEKELSRKLFRRVRRQRAIELKKIHAERVKKLRRLRRLKQKTAMVEQIAAWKKKGYETRFLEERIKPLSAKEIRKQMQKWKNRGYKIPISE
jgi:23S rRNA pseudoU1915 N3-methylase RlmH